MGLFHDGVKRRMAKDGIVATTPEQYEDLYVKYRDEMFMERYNKPYDEWKIEKDKERQNKK